MAEISEEEFVKLIENAEQDSQRNMRGYKLKLALFAALGYAVIFAVLIALFLLVGGTVAIALVSGSLFLLLVKKKIIWVILFAIWTFLRALWVKFDQPTGFTLAPKDYPNLFEQIDDLTKQLDALKIHQVIVENNLNAAVVQTPRFGLFCGQKNTLFLGIQLLLALPPKEMRSVLAHEFGHLSGNHSRFSGWIYRIRITWQRISDAFSHTDSFGASIMRRFFEWYAPKFSAYSFALARNNEYEADRAAVELTSPDITASALINVHAKAPYIEREYWDVYFKTADTHPEPTTAPFEGLAAFLKRAPLTGERLKALVEEEMQVETHYADTHPALKDRVSEIVDKEILPEDFEQNAAEAWLGDKYQAVLSHFDAIWLEQNQPHWKERYDYVTESKALLETSGSQALESLDDDTLWRVALASYEFQDGDTAENFFAEFLHRNPESAGAAYYMGEIKTSKEDETAIDYLRIALSGVGVWEEAARMGYQLLHSLEKEDAAEAWKEEALEIYAKHSEAQEELSNATINDEFEAAVPNEESLESLKEALAAHKNVRAGWVARKILKQDTGQSVYVVAVRTRGFYLSSERVLQSIADSLPDNENYFVVLLEKEWRKFGKKVKDNGVQIV